MSLPSSDSLQRDRPGLLRKKKEKISFHFQQAYRICFCALRFPNKQPEREKKKTAAACGFRFALFPGASRKTARSSSAFFQDSLRGSFLRVRVAPFGRVHGSTKVPGIKEIGNVRAEDSWTRLPRGIGPALLRSVRFVGRAPNGTVGSSALSTKTVFATRLKDNCFEQIFGCLISRGGALVAFYFCSLAVRPSPERKYDSNAGLHCQCGLVSGRTAPSGTTSSIASPAQ